MRIPRPTWFSRPPVNQRVVGSSPTPGANLKEYQAPLRLGFLYAAHSLSRTWHMTAPTFLAFVDGGGLALL
jgi:hypothetical protein